MKTKSNKRIILCLILSFLLTSCTSITPTKTPEEISDALALEYPFGEVNLDYGQVTVWVTNTSTYCIVFPTDFGLRLFVNTNGTISEIPNNTSYIGDRLNYLRPRGDLDSIMGLVFSPDTSQLNFTPGVRFYAEIYGHICEDDSILITKKIPFKIIE